MRLSLGMARSGSRHRSATLGWSSAVAGAVLILALGTLAAHSALSSGSAGASVPPAIASWQPEPLPLPAHTPSGVSAYAGPVACPAIAKCEVLGEYQTPAGLNEDLISTQHGTTWSTVVAPLPSGGIEAANLGPYQLRCTGLGDCIGTSLYESSTSIAADILIEFKGRWSAIAMPMPANAIHSSFPTIDFMACPRLGACVIVGTYAARSGLTEGLIVREVNGRFVAGQAPVPGGLDHGSALDSVACEGASTCVAAGDYVTPSGSTEPLFVTDSAGSLRASVAPLPPNAAAAPSAEVEGVSCASASICVALGSYEDAAGDRVGFIDTSSSGQWVATAMPSPAGASALDPSPEIDAVACKAGYFCLAVGHYTDSSGNVQGLVLMEEAGIWLASMMPGTTDTNVIMHSVACVSATSCAATGHYDAGGAQFGYLLTLSGSTLSGTVSPMPPNANPNPESDLGFVACPWLATCVATGVYSDGDAQLPLALSGASTPSTTTTTTTTTTTVPPTTSSTTTTTTTPFLPTTTTNVFSTTTTTVPFQPTTTTTTVPPTTTTTTTTVSPGAVSSIGCPGRRCRL